MGSSCLLYEKAGLLLLDMSGGALTDACRRSTRDGCFCVEPEVRGRLLTAAGTRKAGMLYVAFLIELGEAKAWVNLRNPEMGIVLRCRLSNHSRVPGRASW